MKKRITNIAIVLVEIEEDGYHIMVPVQINGITANLLLDTGASRTVFDSQNILNFLPGMKKQFEKNEKLSTGLGTNSLESHVTTLRNLKLGDLIINDYEAVILDLRHVNESYEKLGLPKIDGVLGSDLMKKHDAVIYYRENKIKLYY